MSMSYWMIEGIGLNTQAIEPYVNSEKLIRHFFGDVPKDKVLREMVKTGDYSRFDLEEFCYGYGYESLADVLCHCDDTDSITLCSDGDGAWYFYYPPSMPWHHTATEPKSEQEVIDRIVAAVQKITDLRAEDIVSSIDTELHVLGAG